MRAATPIIRRVLRLIAILLLAMCAATIACPEGRAYELTSIIEETKALARQHAQSPLELARLLQSIAITEHEIGRDEDSLRTFTECRDAIAGSAAPSAYLDRIM